MQVAKIIRRRTRLGCLGERPDGLAVPGNRDALPRSERALANLVRPARIPTMNFPAARSFTLGMGLLPLLFSHAAEPPDVNYDESKVPAYRLPDPLETTHGTRVTTAAAWQAQRRPEIVSLFEEQVYGRAPGAPRAPTFAVTSVDTNALSGKATRKEITVHLTGDDAGPGMQLLLYVPNQAPKPVPAFLGLNFYGNHGIHPDPGISLSTRWMRPTKAMGVVNNRATEASRGCQSNQWQLEFVLDRGYALATVYYGDIEPDFREGWKMGVRASLASTEPGGTAQPDAWSAIGAWAWGLSRALDCLEREEMVDARRVALLGHSRLGKTALWAGAVDQRFAIVISNNSGEGGAALARRCFGERTHHLVDAVPYWFCRRYAEYARREAALPVDAHLLIALMAPRPVYIASAAQDLWADPLGEFLAGREAGPVYQLFGLKGTEAAQQPGVDQPVGDYVRYHVRSGDHDVTAYDWQQFLDFADRHFGRRPPGRK